MQLLHLSVSEYIEFLYSVNQEILHSLEKLRDTTQTKLKVSRIFTLATYFISL